MNVVGPLDLGQLAERATHAAQAWRPGVQIADIVALEGGQSSLTFCATLDPRDELLVLKVAPPGLPPVRNRDVLRQARVLSALSQVPGMRVPSVLFTDTGGGLDQPPFFAMSHVRGTSFEPHLTAELDDASNRDIASRAHHAARLLALLHRQPAERLGLAGEPIVLLTDEVGRWERAFATVPEIDHSLVRRALDVLRADIPSEGDAGIVHGDFRLGNMLSEAGEVHAVIDWEIWSRADPRVDLGWFLLCADARLYPAAVRDHPGMPSADDLLREYIGAFGAPVDRLEWFTSLALTKMAATTALISKHNRRSGRIDESERAAPQIVTMLQRAIAASPG